MKLSDKHSYRIFSREKRKAIAVENASMENGAHVKLEEPSDSDSQIWQVVYHDDTWFQLINTHSNKALDLCMAGVANGTWLHQWESVESDSQLWCAIDAELDLLTIQSKKSGRCVDVSIVASGVPVQIWDEVKGGFQQQWGFEDVSAEQEAPKVGKTAAAKKPVAKRTSSKKTAAKDPAPANTEPKTVKSAKSEAAQAEAAEIRNDKAKAVPQEVLEPAAEAVKAAPEKNTESPKAAAPAKAEKNEVPAAEQVTPIQTADTTIIEDDKSKTNSSNTQKRPAPSKAKSKKKK